MQPWPRPPASRVNLWASFAMATPSGWCVLTCPGVSAATGSALATSWTSCTWRRRRAGGRHRLRLRSARNTHSASAAPWLEGQGLAFWNSHSQSLHALGPRSAAAKPLHPIVGCFAVAFSTRATGVFPAVLTPSALGGDVVDGAAWAPAVGASAVPGFKDAPVECFPRLSLADQEGLVDVVIHRRR